MAKSRTLFSDNEDPPPRSRKPPSWFTSNLYDSSPLTTATKAKGKATTRKAAPKPPPAKSVKRRSGLAPASHGKSAPELRAKVLAAVVRISREKGRSKQGVGHASINKYIHEHAPPSEQGRTESLQKRVLEVKHDLVDQGVLTKGESEGVT